MTESHIVGVSHHRCCTRANNAISIAAHSRMTSRVIPRYFPARYLIGETSLSRWRHGARSRLPEFYRKRKIQVSRSMLVTLEQGCPTFLGFSKNGLIIAGATFEPSPGGINWYAHYSYL